MNSIENSDDATTDSASPTARKRNHEKTSQFVLPGLDSAPDSDLPLDKQVADRAFSNAADTPSPLPPPQRDSPLRALAKRLGFTRDTTSSGDKTDEQQRSQQETTEPSIAEATPQLSDTVSKVAYLSQQHPETLSSEFLRNRYLIDANQNYYFRDRDQVLAFEDLGSKIRTRHDDAEIAASMVELALTKGWTNPKVRGSATFKREAWLAGAERGMAMSGYRPTPLDKARLAERLATRERSPTPMPQSNEMEEKNLAQPQQTAPPDVNAGRQRKQKNPSPEKATESANKNPQHRRAVKQLEQFLRQRGDSETAIGMTCELAAEELSKHRTHFGKLVEQGDARYRHDADNDWNYFVTLETPEGRQTIWGIDLKRAIADSGTDIGDGIVLAQHGKRGVTVAGPERDSEGNPTGKRISLDANRNDWCVISLDNAREFLHQQSHPNRNRATPEHQLVDEPPQRAGPPAAEQQLARAR